jgi:5-oxoprolinase (ATP-hydrolysing)
MRRAFEEAHRARFGFLRRGEALVFDLLEVEATGLSPNLPEAAPPPTNGAAKPLGQSQLWWQGAWAPMPIYARGDLPVGAALNGPALISDPAGTVIVDPGWHALCDPQGNLILEADAQPQTLAETDEDPTPARLERWGNFYMALAEEMGVTLASTAWSVNIKERLDFSCALFDAAGDLVANAPHVPVHLGSMSDAVKAVIAKTQGRVEEGSAYALNSPYDGGTHLPDVTLVTPVLWQGQAVAWLGSRGHHADIGGRTPGSSPPDSRSIAEEGILLPVTQVVRRGKLLRAALLKRLTAGPYPCRAPLQNLADLEAQIAANETGRRALLEALARPGGGAALTFMHHLQANAEEAVRALIDDLPEGAFTLNHDNGAQIAVELRIDRVARRATLDFTGTSPQQEGNFNAPLAVTKAVVLYVFRCLLGRALPLNEGCLRPLTLIVPEGTLLNPRPPAAVIAGNTEVSQTLCNALLAALGAAAASQGTMNNFVWGNARFQNYETIAGGAGAGPGFAGASAVQTHMTNTRMTDPEVLERRFPVRLEHFGFRQGSGGVGLWPGGEGLKRRLRFLDAVTVTVLSGARLIPPFGMAGGGPGACGVNRAISADGQITPLGGYAEINLQASAAFEMETPGGGGWGVPD